MFTRIRTALNKKDQGFTLIELLVVIIIIGILAAIAIPIGLDQRKKAVDASMKADLRQMALVQENYIIDHPGAISSSNTNFSLYIGPGGSASVNVAAPAIDFQASPGNTIAVGYYSATTGGYCILARNSGASQSYWMFYDSVRGGLLGFISTPNPTSGACNNISR